MKREPEINKHDTHLQIISRKIQDFEYFEIFQSKEQREQPEPSLYLAWTGSGAMQ